MTRESPVGVDPFTRPNPNRERIVAAVTMVALAWSVVYLVWRALTTLDGADGPTAIVLLAAEVLGVGMFAVRVRSASRPPVPPVDVPDVPRPEVTAVIDASGASIDELRTTLLSLRRVEGLGELFVVGTGESPSLRGVAERLAATVHPTDVGVHRALASAPSPWVLLVEAGDLPTPDLVVMAAAACCAPDVGIVQLGLEEADPTTFELDVDGRWSLEPFEHQVVRPALAAGGSIPWYGDGPTLIRRAALDQAGGWAEGDTTWMTGARIIRSGFRVTHVPLTLARVRASTGFGDGLARRQRRNSTAVRALFDGSMRGLPRHARTAHLIAATPVMGAAQRVLMVVAAVMVLGVARVPLVAPGLHLALLATPAYVLRWVAQLLLGRGRLSRLSTMRSELRSLGVDLVPFARWSAVGARRAGVVALVAVIVALDLAVVVSAVSVWRDWNDPLPGDVAAVALVFVAVFVGVAMEVLIDALIRRQRRVNRRVKLGLVTCRLEEHEGHLADLSTRGAGVVLPCGINDAPMLGMVTTVSFRIPDADGAWRSVSALVEVTHRVEDPDGGTRLGLAFDDPSAAPLDPVVEFLTIDRRLVALGRRRLVVSGHDDRGF